MFNLLFTIYGEEENSPEGMVVAGENEGENERENRKEQSSGQMGLRDRHHPPQVVFIQRVYMFKNYGFRYDIDRFVICNYGCKFMVILNLLLGSHV